MGKLASTGVIKTTLRAAAFSVCGSVIVSIFPGCNSARVGDPCVPEDEYSEKFSSFSAEEVNVESASLQCESRLCLSNHFQGRVSCPYGQTEQQAQNDPRCFIPGTKTPVSGAVEPQLLARRAEDTVYCSCRCDGPEANARYCECPSGYACKELVPRFGLNKQAQLVGSYCIKEGTAYDSRATSRNTCDPQKEDCS